MYEFIWEVISGSRKREQSPCCGPQGLLSQAAQRSLEHASQGHPPTARASSVRLMYIHTRQYPRSVFLNEI